MRFSPAPVASSAYPGAVWPSLREAMSVDKKARGARLRLVVLDGLARAFPHASIGHAYASTEAGVGFAVEHAKHSAGARGCGRCDTPRRLDSRPRWPCCSSP